MSDPRDREREDVEARTVPGYVVWDERYNLAFRGRIYPNIPTAEAIRASIVWHSRDRYAVREIALVPKSKAVTFDELVQAGIDQGVPLNNGMPWSFIYAGYPVSHENDDLYLITTPTATLRLKRGDVLVMAADHLRVEASQ